MQTEDKIPAAAPFSAQNPLSSQPILRKNVDFLTNMSALRLTPSFLTVLELG